MVDDKRINELVNRIGNHFDGENLEIILTVLSILMTGAFEQVDPDLRRSACIRVIAYLVTAVDDLEKVDGAHIESGPPNPKSPWGLGR